MVTFSIFVTNVRVFTFIIQLNNINAYKMSGKENTSIRDYMNHKDPALTTKWNTYHMFSLSIFSSSFFLHVNMCLFMYCHHVIYEQIL